MRLRFLLGTLFGIFLGGAAGWGLQTYLQHKLLPHAAPLDSSTPEEPSPEDAAVWLMPRDYGVKDAFDDEKALRCVLNPESVTAYLADKKGPLKLCDYRFSSDGVPVEKSNIPFLRKVWEAPNAYRPVSACMFNPGVLLECKNGGDAVKIIICFSCQDMLWVLNDHEDKRGGMGLTEYALMTLKAVLRQSFPDNPAFL
jgi:hypothetical protein